MKIDQEIKEIFIKHMNGEVLSDLHKEYNIKTSYQNLGKKIRTMKQYFRTYKEIAKEIL